MRFINTFLILNFLFINYLYADKYSCIKATKKYESLYELPANLLLSVSLIESGRKLKNGEFISWPWTINVRGKGKYFKNKHEAIKYVKEYTSNGKTNLDIGCMQINYMYHPNAFNSFEEAFDPDKNVKWSANLLQELFVRFGSWKAAVGYYHSYRTNRRINYSNKVFNKWVSIKNDTFYESFSSETLLSKAALNKVTEEKSYKVKNVDNVVNIGNNNNVLLNENNSKKEPKNNNDNKQKLQNPYIVARMEKVKFFRDYFSQTRNN